jgi:hypothetical protein
MMGFLGWLKPILEISLGLSLPIRGSRGSPDSLASRVSIYIFFSDNSFVFNKRIHTIAPGLKLFVKIALGTYHGKLAHQDQLRGSEMEHSKD